jgi:large conductance mechanosensitive channel
MSTILNEFKAFAMKGNVVDLAVGVVIGSSFGAIVTSLVGDVIMPIIGVLTNGIDFSGLAYKVGNASVAYGKFLQAIFVFVVVAWVLFMVIKGMNSMKKKEESKPSAPSEDVVLLREIRDALKNR